MEWEKWLPMPMNKQVVLLMAHYGCNMAAIEQKYIRLRTELSSEQYDVVLLFNVNDKSLLEETPCVDKICIYDLQDINALQYEPICPNLLPGSCHFPVLRFFLDHPTYTYYWFIEYDVEFTGTWDILMDAYFANNADFIASHLRYYLEDTKWEWWTRDNDVGFPLEECLKAFHPICRYSNMALTHIHHYQSAGHSAHSELLIPTCLYHAGYRLLDMGGCGSFVEKGYENRFYVCNEHVNTMRYRPCFSKVIPVGGQQRAILFHPVKNIVR